MQENMGMRINKNGYYSWPFVATNEDNFKYVKLVMMCEKRLLVEMWIDANSLETVWNSVKI